MPLRDQFNQLKNKLQDLNRQHNILPFGQENQQSQQYQQYPGQQQQYPGQQYQQYQGGPQQQYAAPNQYYDYNRPPPPVPQYSHPGQQQAQQSQVQRYWQAKFDPSIPVSQEFDQKQGNNNGWGNNELEHYTGNPENSFYTNDHKLIIRAIANNSSPNPEGKYTSARLVTRQTLSRPQGVLTTVLTQPCASGIWPAFWLLPREPFTWPHEGEIDIAESWNAECKNHSCLHWGFYNPEDNWKHLTKGTPIPDMASRPVRFDFAWHESGRIIFYIDGRPVMKAKMPDGTRPLHDWCVVINVAMGGNVCAGQTPKNGAYDFVVHELYMTDAPEFGGWNGFESDWQQAPDGATL